VYLAIASRVKLIFSRRDSPSVAFSLQVVFDCRDPAGLSRFYAEALHYKMQDPPHGYATWEAFLEERGVPRSEWNSASAIVDPRGKGPRIYFQLMDTPKFGKNRLHIDINASSALPVKLEERKEQVEREVERLVALGATRDHELEETEEYCVIMLDPEGNEFCVQ
jgi:Glyoxalase-like domain